MNIKVAAFTVSEKSSNTFKLMVTLAVKKMFMFYRYIQDVPCGYFVEPRGPLQRCFSAMELQ